MFVICYNHQLAVTQHNVPLRTLELFNSVKDSPLGPQCKTTADGRRWLFPSRHGLPLPTVTN